MTNNSTARLVFLLFFQGDVAGFWLVDLSTSNFQFLAASAVLILVLIVEIASLCFEKHIDTYQSRSDMLRVVRGVEPGRSELWPITWVRLFDSLTVFFKTRPARHHTHMAARHNNVAVLLVLVTLAVPVFLQNNVVSRFVPFPKFFVSWFSDRKS
jgi:hypothetical protein